MSTILVWFWTNTVGLKIVQNSLESVAIINFVFKTSQARGSSIKIKIYLENKLIDEKHWQW